MLPTLFLGLALVAQPVSAVPKSDHVQDPLILQLQEECRKGIAGCGKAMADCHAQRAQVLADCRGRRPSPAEQAALDSFAPIIATLQKSFDEYQATLDQLDKLLTEQEKPTPHAPKTGPKK